MSSSEGAADKAVPASAAGAGDAWIDMDFRGQRVKVRAKSNGDLLVGEGGFVEFRYQVQGKSYKSRPESFEPVAGASVQFVASAPKAATPSASTTTSAAPKKAAAGKTSRVVSGKGGGRIVDLASRRGAKNAVQLWTDGACSGNPGPAGLGVHAEHDGQAAEISEYLGTGTNNIAELMAIVRALELAAERFGVTAPIDVMTDSEYCLGLLGLGWKAKANQEIVERLRVLYARFSDLLLVKVKGHAGVPGNERADELARTAITGRRVHTGPATPLE